jgi:DNA-binding transcriptional regulator YiaG
MSESKAFIVRIKEGLRLQTDKQLAEAIGVSLATVRAWKYGGRKPGRFTLLVIERMLAGRSGDGK